MSEEYKCKCAQCANPEYHTTASHLCGICGCFGHGTIECNDELAREELVTHHNEKMPPDRRCTTFNCKYKWSHSNESHLCRKCKKAFCPCGTPFGTGCYSDEHAAIRVGAGNIYDRGGQWRPFGVGTSSGQQRPFGVGTSSGQQRPFGVGTSVGTSSGQQRPFGTGTGVGTNSGQQRPFGVGIGIGTSSGQQRPFGTGTGVGTNSGQQRPFGVGVGVGTDSFIGSEQQRPFLNPPPPITNDMNNK